MPPRRVSRRRAIEPECQINRIEKILEGLIQVVQDNHNNNNVEAPEESAVQVPRAEVVARTTIKQCQQLKPQLFREPPIPWPQNLGSLKLRGCSKSYLAPMIRK